MGNRENAELPVDFDFQMFDNTLVLKIFLLFLLDFNVSGWKIMVRGDLNSQKLGTTTPQKFKQCSCQPDVKWLKFNVS